MFFLPGSSSSGRTTPSELTDELGSEQCQLAKQRGSCAIPSVKYRCAKTCAGT